MQLQGDTLQTGLTRGARPAHGTSRGTRCSCPSCPTLSSPLQMCQTTQLLSSAHFLSQTFNITGPEICPTDSLSSIASSQDTRGRRRGQEFKVSFMPPPYDATRAGAFPPQSTDIDIMTPMEQSPSSSPSASDRISPNNSQSEIPPATPKAQVQVEAPLDAATSATDEKHPKGKRKRTAYVKLRCSILWDTSLAIHPV